MLGILSKEARSATAYTLASVISRGLAIVSMPIFTRIMTPADIGVVNLYTSWYSMISIVSTLALTSGGYSLAMKEFAEKRDAYESSVLALTTIMAFIVGSAFLAFTGFFVGLTGLSPTLLALMFVGLLVSPAWDFWTLRQRFEYRYRLSFVLSVLSAVLATALSVGAVLFVSSQQAQVNLAEARLVANYCVIYGFAGFMWCVLMARGRTFYDRRFWRFSLSLSLPLIGYSIANQILNVSDRVMIANMVGETETGIYGVLYTASSISLFFWSSINSSYIPYLFQHIDDEGHDGVRETSTALFGTFSLVSVLISWMAPEIIMVLATEEYLSAVSTMPPIAAGVFLTSMSNMYSNILVYYKKTKYIMFAAVGAAVVNVLLNLVAIPIFGYGAAAYSTLISYVVLAVSQYAWANRACKEAGRKMAVYEDGKLALLAVISMVATMLGIPLYSMDFIRYAACILLVVAAVCLFLRSKRMRGV